ncbi:MAG: Zn-ribbon domain-containing OB-fold protein [Promethearchaeota archaeon]
MTEKIIVANKGFIRAEFAFWVGRYLDKFYDALENKKIIGNKCPKCGDVFVPPRKICGKCNEKIHFEENWVDLPDTGTLKNYTITHYKVNDRACRKVKKPQIIGMVQIDGSNTAIIYRLLDLEQEEVKTGMKLRIQWEEIPKGDPSDIKGFVRNER